MWGGDCEGCGEDEDGEGAGQFGERVRQHNGANVAELFIIHGLTC